MPPPPHSLLLFPEAFSKHLSYTRLWARSWGQDMITTHKKPTGQYGRGQSKPVRSRASGQTKLGLNADSFTDWLCDLG